MYATGLAGGKPCVRFLAPSPPRPPRPRVLRRADAEFSKKEMLKFAIPALGISIASPFMTNIDNAFVGRLSGTKALAAMSPGSVLSDYILYLFVFLPRATTGLVARALPWGRPKAAQRLGTALSTALVLGTVLTAVYVFATPLLLNLLDVAPELRPGAGTYVRVRGLVAWAALMQSVALSGLLAAKDSLTPLKVVLFAALLNLLGDFFLCAWPFHWGIFGAALATSISTLMGFRMMWRALRRNRLMPGHLSMPKREELQPLLEYAKPLSVVILFRFMSLTFMAKCAGMMGTAVTAAYQVLANVIVLFGLFGEPLSQTAQTMLPGLLDRPSREARELMKNLAVVALGIAGSVGLLSAVALKASAQLFTTDPQVQGILRGTTMVPVTVASLILSQVCDGAMLAAREFPLVIKITVVATSFQVLLLMAATHFNWSLEGQAIFEAFQELHAPGVSLRKPVTWPVEEAADVLFVHPMAGNCALLDSLLQSLPRVEDLPKLLYVGINPLLPPPMLVVPDFVRHWQKHQTLSQKVMDSHTEEPDAWAVRSMTSHILAQCSLSQVTKMLSRYRLLQVEHLFAVFAHQSLFRALQLEEPGHVAEFEAWRGGWFCSPLAASLFSLEQFGVPDERWLAIGAMDEEESQAAAEEASCSFLAAQELQAEEAYMRCGSRRTSWAQGLAMEGIDLRRQRVQWVLRQPVLPGVVLELSKTGRGYCSDECECFAPWRGLLCDTLDAGGTTHRRNYSAAIQYIVNEDPTHLAELRHSLRNLWRHFNQKFDYPVQIFHDGLSDELRAGLVRSSSNRLWFHHLPKDFIPEPHQLPPELSVEDEHRSVSHTFSAGYRAQCRFRSGPLFEHPAVATLDYLMSLDTDSMFPREVNWDPIEAMHGNGSRVLGYSSLLVSSSAYVRGLWPAVLQFLAYEGLDLRQGRAPEHFLRRPQRPRTTWWPTMGWWS
ncbi:unnamed protein product [Durusdinium trenchii]|uniref:Protein DETOXIFICATION n=1 Tax=Durusdinium trenchii TaxID=1381693 RepID=A0ABP0RQF2_9DINO